MDWDDLGGEDLEEHVVDVTLDIGFSGIDRSVAGPADLYGSDLDDHGQMMGLERWLPMTKGYAVAPNHWPRDIRQRVGRLVRDLMIEDKGKVPLLEWTRCATCGQVRAMFLADRRCTKMIKGGRCGGVTRTLTKQTQDALTAAYQLGGLDAAVSMAADLE